MHHTRFSAGRANGFSLLELAVVLIVIGLILGGIFVGRDMIRSANVRAEIAQIDRLNSSVRDFHQKYEALPGDMPLVLATNAGLKSDAGCDGSAGKRNGDGLITDYAGNKGVVGGEASMFWQDLYNAGLASETFPLATTSTAPLCAAMGHFTLSTGALNIGNILPPGRIGYGTFLYIYSDNQINWIGLSTITDIANNNVVTSKGQISIMEANAIDQKIDDGIATSGSVQAVYENGSVTTLVQSTNSVTDDSTTCYNTTTGLYSISINSGKGTNCGLSFQFQQ